MIVTSRHHVFSITLEDSEYETLSAVAKTRGMSAGEIIETALNEDIDAAYSYLRTISDLSPAAAGVARSAAIKITNGHRESRSDDEEFIVSIQGQQSVRPLNY